MKLILCLKSANLNNKSSNQDKIAQDTSFSTRFFEWSIETKFLGTKVSFDTLVYEIKKVLKIEYTLMY